MTPDRLGLGVKYEGPPIMDPKQTKQDFLKGDKEVVMYFDKKELYGSSYAANLKGLQVSPDRRAFVLDNQRTSYVGHTIPDPTTLGKLPSPSLSLSLTLSAYISLNYEPTQVYRE